MASVSALRAGIRDRLATVPGLRAYSYVPSQINPPVAVVIPETIGYDSTMARGSDDFAFVVQLAVSKVVDDDSQDALDAYLAGSGATSVKAAVEGEETLGGVAHFARVAQARSYGIVRFGDLQYLGAELVVEVTADGAV